MRCPYHRAPAQPLPPQPLAGTAFVLASHDRPSYTRQECLSRRKNPQETVVPGRFPSACVIANDTARSFESLLQRRSPQVFAVSSLEAAARDGALGRYAWKLTVRSKDLAFHGSLALHIRGYRAGSHDQPGTSTANRRCVPRLDRRHDCRGGSRPGDAFRSLAQPPPAFHRARTHELAVWRRPERAAATSTKSGAPRSMASGPSR